MFINIKNYIKHLTKSITNYINKWKVLLVITEKNKKN